MASNHSIPDIMIDGITYRRSTFASIHASDPASMQNRCENLDDLLRECHIRHESENVYFWPDELLIRIMTRDRVMHDLELYGGFSPEKSKEYTNQIVIENSESTPGLGRKKYLKIFTVLVLLDKISDIAAFIEAGIGDRSLPLAKCFSPAGERQNTAITGFALRESPSRKLEQFEKWKRHLLDAWDVYQWRLVVPFFAMGPGNAVVNSRFNDDQTILPWCSSKTVRREGGFATVKKVQVDPSCHGFHGVLDSISMEDGFFALKILNNKDVVNFNKEVDMLKRFSGLVHEHLVTLLTTFTWREKYHLLFPWADCDMDEYMDRVPGPIARDADAMRWLSGQILGIAKAIGVIHNPIHLPEDPRFGRHGDLKPENVLWFKSNKEPFRKRGIFVISDFGLGAFHRDTSRSNIPNHEIPNTPGYRPPECDVKGGEISRAFDIWTLGCLFLELVTWCLGGSGLRQRFTDKRMESIYITGVRSNIFFDVQRKGDGPGYVISVKGQVTEWFKTLHAMPTCTEYIHDILDMIQADMIKVISEATPTRIGSATLINKLGRIHARVLDETESGYITDPCPRDHVFVADKPVEVTLNQVAQGHANGNHMLAKFPGVSQRGLSR